MSERRTIKLSQEDYEFFVEFCEKEPNPEQVKRLKKLFSKQSPWDVPLSDGLDEWEWDDEDK